MVINFNIARVEAMAIKKAIKPLILNEVITYHRILYFFINFVLAKKSNKPRKPAIVIKMRKITKAKIYHTAVSGFMSTTIQEIPNREAIEIKKTNGNNLDISLF